MNKTIRNGVRPGDLTTKNVKKKLSSVGDVFNTYDLKYELDKRKLFGEYSLSYVRHIIGKAQRLRLIEKHRNGSNKLGDPDTYKKIK